MGTRGFLGFVVGGEAKIAYNHFDSDPPWLGTAVASWAASADLQAARKAAVDLRVVNDARPPTLRDVRRLRKYTDESMLSGSGPPDWYGLLRGTQGDPAAILACGYIEDAADFPRRSLFAEWGYLVDFDAGQLEVYRGFQHELHEVGRFADPEPDEDGYWPVRLIATFPLDAPDYAALRALEHLPSDPGTHREPSPYEGRSGDAP